MRHLISSLLLLISSSLFAQDSAKLIVGPSLAPAFVEAHPGARIGGISLRSRKGKPEIQRSERVEGNGDIVFASLPPGPYELIATVGIPESTQAIELGIFDLKAGEERRHDAILDPPLFRGRILNGSDLQLTIWGDLGGRGALVNANGEFAILLPKAETYSVHAIPRNRRDQLIEFGVIEFRDPSKPIELRIPRGAVEVTVTEGGKPAAGAQVFAALQRDGDVYTAFAPRANADATGTAKFESLLEGRTWTFEARGERGLVASRSIVIDGDEPVRIALELREPAVMRGMIRDHKGARVDGAQVHCLYLAAGDVPKIAQWQREPDGQFTAKLASAPVSAIRCGAQGTTIGMFASEPSRTAEFQLPPDDKTGTLVIANWRHTVRTRNTIWLANARGDVFNVDWVGGGAGPAPAPLTIDRLPAGEWKIVRANSLQNLVSLARGTTSGLQEIAAVTIPAGKKTELLIPFE